MFDVPSNSGSVMGFYGLACGVRPEELEYCCPHVTYLLHKRLIHGMIANLEIGGKEIKSHPDDSVLATEILEWNDLPDVDDSQREEVLTYLFSLIDVSVTFTP